MSGPGGGSGYDYQADAFAYVASYALAGTSLNWAGRTDDVPVAIELETGRPGDDLLVETINRLPIEIQAKFHAEFNEDFRKSLIRLIRGLARDATMRGVMLVDSTSTNTITRDLKRDVERLGQGRADGLSKTGKRLLKELGAQLPASTYKRLTVIVLDLDRGSMGEENGVATLRSVLEDPTLALDAWQRLGKLGLQGTALSGRSDLSSLIAFLEPTITVARKDTSAAGVLLRYREWLRATFGTFRVIGFRSVRLPTETAWDEMIESEPGSPAIASVAEELQRYHEPDTETSLDRDLRAEDLILLRDDFVMVGPAGVGKSTLVDRLIIEALDEGLVPLRVPLKAVASLLANGETFDDAILHSAFEASGLSTKARASIAPALMIADGLDECGPQRGNVASRLLKWRHGHPQARLIVTTRSFGYAPADFPPFSHAVIQALSPGAIERIAERIFAAQMEDPDAAAVKSVDFADALRENRAATLAARTPLLLGCLAALFMEGLPLPTRRAALFSQVTRLLREQQLDRTPAAPVNETVANRTMEIAGWILVEEPTLSTSALRERTGKQLFEDGLAVSALAGSVLAEAALAFWEDRRLIERLATGALEIYTFVHRSLGEYAAGHFAASLLPAHRDEWTRRTYADSRWREPIVLAAGCGVAEPLAALLLDLGQSDDKAVLLAADALAEADSVATPMIEETVAALRRLLVVATVDPVVNAAERLITIARLAPGVASRACKSLLDHSSALVRLAAEAVVLADTANEIPSGLPEKWLDSFLPIVMLRLGNGNLVPYNPELPAGAHDLQLRTVGAAIDALFRTLPNDEALTIAKQFLSRKHNLDVYAQAEEPMVRHGHHETMAEISVRVHNTWFRPSFFSFDTPAHRAELEALLAAITAAVGQPELVEEKPRWRLISRLFSAIGLFRADDHIVIRSLEDRELLDLAVDRTIVAAGIDRTGLRHELASAYAAAGQLTARGIYAHVREVRLRPNWRRAGLVEPERVRAMVLHDSSIISWVGTNLLEHGAAADETVDLLRDAFRHGRRRVLFWLTQIAPDLATPIAAAEMIAERLFANPSLGILHALARQDLALMRIPEMEALLRPELMKLMASEDKEISKAASEALRAKP